MINVYIIELQHDKLLRGMIISKAPTTLSPTHKFPHNVKLTERGEYLYVTTPLQCKNGLGTIKYPLITPHGSQTSLKSQLPFYFFFTFFLADVYCSLSAH